MADNALGRFLRARREATSPAAVGLTPDTRRRTPGLRRGEVAERAGISVEYLTRLERGSDRYPSGQVLATLADALDLTVDERVHLYRLIKVSSGAECQQSSAPAAPRPTVLAILDRLEPAPAVVVDAVSDVLAYTAGFRTLVTPTGLLDALATPTGALAAHTGLLDEDRPNLVRYAFADARARALYPDWARIAADRAAALRAAADLGEPGAAAMAVELSITVGADFGDRYAAASALPAATGMERWAHPEAGPLLLAYETLTLPGPEEHRLLVYLPGDQATEAALDGLLLAASH